MLRLITYNCYNIKSSIQDICDLCNAYDLIFLQEIWLFQHECLYYQTLAVNLKVLVPLLWILLTV